DTADGGPGDDRIELGLGDDRATGQEGNDILNGEEGADLLEGDTGDDRVAGEAGPDKLLGGPGSDELLAAGLDDRIYTTSINSAPNSPVDSWRDSVDCGPDTDEAAVNRWDQTEACELVRRVRAVRILDVEHRRRAGIAVLTAKTFGPGQVTMYSRGRSAIRTVPRRVVDDEEIFLPVRPTHRTLAELHRTGRVRVTVWISFRPAGGLVRREAAHTTLVLVGR
ncbi:MAG TPA: calcium-binding protein, partial [Planctomycetaceae bacterium]